MNTKPKSSAETEELRARWLDFKAKVYPNGMTPEQEKEVYRAFVAGAAASLRALDKLSVIPDPHAIVAIEDFFQQVTCESLLVVQTGNGTN